MRKGSAPLRAAFSRIRFGRGAALKSYGPPGGPLPAVTASPMVPVAGSKVSVRRSGVLPGAPLPKSE